MNNSAARLFSVLTLISPLGIQPYVNTMSRAYLKILSLNAPKNCVANIGAKRRVPSKKGVEADMQ